MTALAMVYFERHFAEQRTADDFEEGIEWVERQRP